MARQRVEEITGSSSHHLPYNNYNSLLYAINDNNNPSSTLINHDDDGPAFDFGELEQAIVLQGGKSKPDPRDSKQSFFSGKAAATLEMFPSWPIKFQQTPIEIGLRRGEESQDESGLSKSDHRDRHYQNQLGMEEESGMNKKACSSTCSSGHGGLIQKHIHQIQPEMILSDVSTTALSQQHHSHLQQKTLRRLAQNREAARKSRLRKKAYVQQLESSRIKLSQIEQDLERARSQGLFVGAGGGILSSGGAMFDIEYARWLEDDHRHTAALRGGLEAHLPDRDLRMMVDACICHYDDIFRLKGEAAKSDVFHLITGIWMSPAERCFLWIGGFRPSDLIKMLMSQVEPITEQQLMEIYKLNHSSQQAEEALSQGLDQLHHSLTETIAGAPLIDGINHMVFAIHKLSNLHAFLHQADILRQQTLHQLHRILTVRQAAKCFMVIGEYYGRLRALSSLWSSRPKEYH